MSEIGSRTRRAVEQLGPHPAAQAGLDLADPGDRVRWLALARLASERAPQQRVLDAFRHLAAEPGAAAGDLAAAGPARVAAVLGEAGLRKPEAVARVLCRAAASLAERYRGDLDALAAECEDLEQLGSRLAALAPGLGTATVLRFLRPLRGVWQAARETPLAETARAGDDLDGEPAALLAACARHAPELSPIDVEAALERLGARACRSERAARCPLEDACPARGV
jgi:endonuclease III